MTLRFRELLTISRPRFWLYTLGPILVGLAATGMFTSDTFLGDKSGLVAWFVLAYVFYFLFPANLLIYGVNDLSDADTDALNFKKGTYEYKITPKKHKQLIRGIIKRNCTGLLRLIPFFFIFLTSRDSFRREFFIVLGLFYFTAIFYSALPIRAKAKPFLDGLFNILYILPGVAITLFLAPEQPLERSYVLGGRARCVAMHAYSAIPDRVPDKKAGIMTTAVFMGKTGTLIYCGFLRLVAAFTIYEIFPLFSLLSGGVYVIICALSYKIPVFRLYTYFPRINAVLGGILFWLIVLK